MIKRTLFCAALASALVFGLLSSAGAGGAPTMTVNPSSGEPGSTFTVSGTQCFFEFNGASVHANGELGPEVTVHVAFPTPLDATTNADIATGTWSVQFTVPAGTPPGAYDVTATCHNTPINGFGDGDVGTQDFNYPAAPFNVLPATPPATAAPSTPAPEAPAPVPPAPPAPAVAGTPRTTG